MFAVHYFRTGRGIKVDYSHQISLIFFNLRFDKRQVIGQVTVHLNLTPNRVSFDIFVQHIRKV